MNKGILKVTVTDTGCGISKDNLNKLFQQFSQVSLDPSQRKLGTGLGLFITKELCERMGGDIKVFSKEGTGSCFSFCLPMIPVLFVSSNLQNTEDSIPSPTRQRSLKAMIVDDEPFSQGILKNFFDRLQIDVVSLAENGLEAYTKYCNYIETNKSPVVVTMDLTMPVMDGKKSAQKIRKFEQERGLRPCLLIVISGNCSESEIAQCLDKNGTIRANAFLKKPARPDDISRVISQYMARDDLGY